jgi:uncharacterized protein YcbX
VEKLSTMASATQTDLGAVLSLWRYPVKSMMGEELQTARLSSVGLVGDRAYALRDSSDGKVATSKNPRKWPNLFAFRAALNEAAGNGAQAGSVRITLPDGTQVTGEQGGVNQKLSKVLGRDVTLTAVESFQPLGAGASSPGSWNVQAEEYWPDIEGRDQRDTVTSFTLPAGTFFDGAPVHILTTATLRRLHGFYPQGRFEIQRFRPNIVIETAVEKGSFVEDAWVGQILALGDEVRLNITKPSARCVMTTLPQGELPRDIGILRTAVEHHKSYVGVYATVVQAGTIRRGDKIRLGA